MGVEASVTKYVTQVQKVVQSSGLKSHMHSYGTTIEGPWDQVMETIGKSHEAIHAIGCPRIATDIRIGTRIDKHATMEDKVRTVRELLATEGKTIE